MMVLLRLDPQDGNDPIENAIELPIVPRVGDHIEVWWSDRSDWLEVEDVVLCAYAPERVEVWVSHEGYDLDVARRLVEVAAVAP